MNSFLSRSISRLKTKLLVKCYNIINSKVNQIVNQLKSKVKT